MSRAPVDHAARLWKKVRKTSTCWIWTGTLNHDGYGRVQVDRKRIYIHRFFWQISEGVIPDGMQIDHICHNRACVNPQHLRPVTQNENSQNLRGPTRRNKTGALGVRWDKGRQNYRVTVTRNRKQYPGGSYLTLEEAAEAAKNLRLALFTHNELDRKAT